MMATPSPHPGRWIASTATAPAACCAPAKPDVGRASEVWTAMKRRAERKHPTARLVASALRRSDFPKLKGLRSEAADCVGDGVTGHELGGLILLRWLKGQSTPGKESRPGEYEGGRDGPGHGLLLSRRHDVQLSGPGAMKLPERATSSEALRNPARLQAVTKPEPIDLSMPAATMI